MKRLAFLIDLVSFVCFLFLTSTGILLHYLLPPGSGRWSAIWGFTRHQWGDIHFWISVIFFGVLSVHIILHWRIIISMIKGKDSKEPKLRLALGVVGLIVILLLSAAPLLSPTN